jgi:succinoglycan biosynthesis protein ExoO
VTKSHIVFLTRDPVVHQLGGSTTGALNLLNLVARQGAEVTMVATSAYSRSPRLWFTIKAQLPEGVAFFAPGYLRLGKLYLNLFSAKAWARLIARLAVRLPWLSPLRSVAESVYGEALFTNAWDLTAVTLAESDVALLAVERRQATTVIVNYACWAPLFRDSQMAGRKRVIMMHDLLSARVKRFAEAGLPLDSNEIDEETEMSWLNRSDCVIAAQGREADYVRQFVKARVVLQPVVFYPQASSTQPEFGRCLFVGSNILPNQTGLQWLLREVWPKVLAAEPRATLTVVGTVSQTLSSSVKGVQAMGIVESLAAEYAKATVCVVPLLVGSGIKIKLLEAMSFGKATVSTTIGVQGVEQWATQATAVTDDPTEFAAAIVTLLHDEPARKLREAAGLALIREHYDASSPPDPEFAAGVL